MDFVSVAKQHITLDKDGRTKLFYVTAMKQEEKETPLKEQDPH